MIPFQQILEEIGEEIIPYKSMGEVSAYIPELANVSQKAFGMHLKTNAGETFEIGDAATPFSIQSISKVFSLSLALSLAGEKIWERVGVEPSGSRFNSLVQLEYEKGIPRNPFINAGALVIADTLVSLLAEPKADFLAFVHTLAQDSSISYDAKVAASEKAHGFRNAALVNMLKSFGNIENDVNTVLDFYFHQCALAMNCRQLAQAFGFLSHAGKIPGKDKNILSGSQTKRLNAIMLTCGFYDEAGEFSYKVGLPGKSGVGGGIAALHPGHYTVATWGPKLNEKGNSVLGMKSLELLTTKTGMSIF